MEEATHRQKHTGLLYQEGPGGPGGKARFYHKVLGIWLMSLLRNEEMMEDNPDIEEI